MIAEHVVGDRDAVIEAVILAGIERLLVLRDGAFGVVGVEHGGAQTAQRLGVGAVELQRRAIGLGGTAGRPIFARV